MTTHCSQLPSHEELPAQDKSWSHLGEHGFEAGPGFSVQAPGHITRGAHEVLLALPSASALSLVYEGMVGGAHTLQEEVMAVQELAVPLQEEHGDGEHAPQDVGKAVAKLQAHSPR